MSVRFIYLDNHVDDICGCPYVLHFETELFPFLGDNLRINKTHLSRMAGKQQTGPKPQ
ncbi:hypothetical protein DPMN_060731 [Dreissena polymorpha]|uniref:Uncharacterized protein n=1 Tax=Dreissena polymorpha TaxID=45954 RepID=A0A9D4HG86_DREPO|nr:hypothetical protein DPMN_060731 [Dreissena polymorpha]